MPIKAWFPTFIYEAPLQTTGGAAFARVLASECQKIRRHDQAGLRWSRKNYPGGYTSYGSMSQLHQTFSTFGELERKLGRHARAFARHMDLDLGAGRLRMSDCWVNIMSRAVTHSWHLHPLSVISGTYYVKTPRGCSRLRFEDPRLDRFMATPPRREGARPENRTHVSHDVAPGRVILFPSWLRHEVTPNPTTAERISVSFNFEWK